jgi:uncharacterized membrane protein
MMTESLLDTLLWFYLFFALLPVIVAWRRGLPTGEIRKTFVYGVLLGWTVIGYAVAWLIATDDPTPTIRIHTRMIVRVSSKRDPSHDETKR